MTDDPITAYGEAWLAVDADERRALLEVAWAPDAVVDRHAHDVLALGERWDVVLDVPGALRFSAVRPVLTADGVLVTTRPLSTDAVRGLVQRTGPRVSAVATRRSPVDLAHLAHLVDAGRLRVPVDRVVAMDGVADAHAHAASGELRGKVVVGVAEAQAVAG